MLLLNAHKLPLVAMYVVVHGQPSSTSMHILWAFWTRKQQVGCSAVHELLTDSIYWLYTVVGHSPSLSLSLLYSLDHTHSYPIVRTHSNNYMSCYSLILIFSNCCTSLNFLASLSPTACFKKIFQLKVRTYSSYYKAVAINFVVSYNKFLNLFSKWICMHARHVPMLWVRPPSLMHAYGHYTYSNLQAHIIS